MKTSFVWILEKLDYYVVRYKLTSRIWCLPLRLRFTSLFEIERFLWLKINF